VFIGVSLAFSNFRRTSCKCSSEISVAGGLADIQSLPRRCDDVTVSRSRVPRPIVQVKTSLFFLKTNDLFYQNRHPARDRNYLAQVIFSDLAFLRKEALPSFVPLKDFQYLFIGRHSCTFFAKRFKKLEIFIYFSRTDFVSLSASYNNVISSGNF